MAKTQKFDNELLMDAVVKYADIYKGKIYATKLAEWAQKSITGLENVRDYHFMRPMEVTDPKTGKKKKVIRSCTAKINEINEVRSMTTAINTNILLKSANIDAFLELKRGEQRELILKTREQVEAIHKRNLILERENKILQENNRRAEEEKTQLVEKQKNLEVEQERINKKLDMLIKNLDEANQREMLKLLGIYNDGIHLDVSKKNVTIDKEFSINEATRDNSVNQGILKNIFNGLEWD